MRTEIERRLARRLDLQKQWGRLEKPSPFSEEATKDFQKSLKTIRAGLLGEYAYADRDIRLLTAVIDRALNEILIAKGAPKLDDGGFPPTLKNDLETDLFQTAYQALPVEHRPVAGTEPGSGVDKDGNKQKSIFDLTGEQLPGPSTVKGKGKKQNKRDDGSTAEPAGPCITKPLDEVESDSPKSPDASGQESAETPPAEELTGSEAANVDPTSAAPSEDKALADFTDEDWKRLAAAEAEQEANAQDPSTASPIPETAMDDASSAADMDAAGTTPAAPVMAASGSRKRTSSKGARR